MAVSVPDRSRAAHQRDVMSPTSTYTGAPMTNGRPQAANGRRKGLRTAAIAIASLLLLAPSAYAAAADPLLPPAGKIFSGVAAGENFSDFQRRTGRRPDVWQHFVQINNNYEWAIERARGADTRLMLHLSTTPGQDLSGDISPGKVAAGGADRWLLSVRDDLVALGKPSYVRFLGEMNNCHNGYAPLNCNGTSRGKNYSAKAIIAAFRRTTLIMRGGEIAAVNAKLHALHQPPLAGDRDALEPAQIAMVWSPMTGGSPMVSALDPARFWPGRKWTDWTGTSFYSRYPAFKWLTPFYEKFSKRPRVPFMFAEWSMWVSGNPSFVRDVFKWTYAHPRTRMLVYNQGGDPGGPFRLSHYPSAGAALRHALTNRRFKLG
jgi:hypothetical protein